MFFVIGLLFHPDINASLKAFCVSHRKRQYYVYVKGGYQSILQKI